MQVVLSVIRVDLRSCNQTEQLWSHCVTDHGACGVGYAVRDRGEISVNYGQQDMYDIVNHMH